MNPLPPLGIGIGNATQLTIVNRHQFKPNRDANLTRSPRRLHQSYVSIANNVIVANIYHIPAEVHQALQDTP
jgi:hypothetical protein